ncbi:unnamed protein product [Closterium sp. Yama58-4]|nr:unnamed protein product [Closterium sp. Yama58-4]
MPNFCSCFGGTPTHETAERPTRETAQQAPSVSSWFGGIASTFGGAAEHELKPVEMKAVGAEGALPRYSEEELRRATGDWRTKLGEGGFGAVYKGMLLLPGGGARGEGGEDGGDGEGGGREGDGEDGEDEEEGGEGGPEEGLEGLEVVEMDGKRFVPVAVKIFCQGKAGSVSRLFFALVRWRAWSTQMEGMVNTDGGHGQHRWRAWSTQMEGMVNTDGGHGQHRWRAWSTQMEGMVNTDGGHGQHRWRAWSTQMEGMVNTDGGHGQHRWRAWSTQMEGMVDTDGGHGQHRWRAWSTQMEGMVNTDGGHGQHRWRAWSTQMEGMVNTDGGHGQHRRRAWSTQMEGMVDTDGGHGRHRWRAWSTQMEGMVDTDGGHGRHRWRAWSTQMEGMVNTDGGHGRHRWRAWSTQMEGMVNTDGGHGQHRWRAWSTQMEGMVNTDGGHGQHRWRAWSTQMEGMVNTDGGHGQHRWRAWSTPISICELTLVLTPPSPSPLFPHLQTEIMVMTALRHPNVLRLLGIGMWGHTISMVSEFVPGGDVSQRLGKAAKGIEPFPWKERLSIAVGSVAGLAAIHKEGFIHRDFKAANVLLTKVSGPLSLSFVASRVVASAQQICPFTGKPPTKPAKPLYRCVAESELACCSACADWVTAATVLGQNGTRILSTLFSPGTTFDALDKFKATPFCGFLAGGSDTCLQLIEGLYCAIMCDPGSSKYLSVQLAPSGKLADSNGTIRICNDFSNRVYNACQSLAFPGVALTIASLIKNPAKFLSLVVTPLASTATPVKYLNTELVPSENGTDSCFLTTPGDKYAQTPLCCDKLTGFPMECPKDPQFSNVSEVLPWVVDRPVPATCAATSEPTATDSAAPSASNPTGSAPSGSSNSTGSGGKSAGLSMMLRGGAWWGWWPAVLAALVLHTVLLH